MTKKAPYWVWKIRLQLLRAAAMPPISLEDLGSAIRQSEKRMNADRPSDSPDDDLVDFECGRIEEILELAFIACQLAITAVISRCRGLHHTEGFRSKNKSGKWELTSRCNSWVSGTRYKQVAVIDAFANYAKHKDEWPRDWRRSKDQASKTAKVIISVGASSGSSANMRKGFERILGHGDFKRVSELGDIVQRWGTKLARNYERDMKAQKLLR
jgi:hypothetical protein